MTPASAPGRAVNAAEFAGLRPAQLAWSAGAVVIVSAGHGALLPVLPAWLASMMTGVDPAEVSRHVGFLGGAYAAGILLGAPLWGVVSDRVGRGRILILGLVGYVASLLLLQLPAMAGLWGIYALRGTTGFFVAAVVPVVSLLVAQHTPEQQRARRFARLGAMSLLGFLFGPAPSVVANEVGPWFGSWFGDGAAWPALSARVVLVLSALLGGLMMLGLAGSLPAPFAADAADQTRLVSAARGHPERCCGSAGR